MKNLKTLEIGKNVKLTLIPESKFKTNLISVYIQRKLDELLDVLLFYENDDTLLVFRKLCKYYFSINPQATVRYINFYKEQNDPEEVKFGKK